MAGGEANRQAVPVVLISDVLCAKEFPTSPKILIQSTTTRFNTQVLFKSATVFRYCQY
jgi:hypothetical protein